MEREKLQPGQCRYALPWNPCRNQAGNERHAECVDLRRAYSRVIKALLDDGQDTEPYIERIMEPFVKVCLTGDDIKAAQWMHDDRGYDWLTIARLIEFTR